MEAFWASLIIPLYTFARILILGVDGKLLVPVSAYRSIGRRADAHCFVGGSGGVAADGP